MSCLNHEVIQRAGQMRKHTAIASLENEKGEAELMCDAA
jgi:hypothetical protein